MSNRAGAAEETPVARAVRAALVAKRAELLSFLRRRAGTAVDADDVLQAALEHALAKCWQLKASAQAEAWLGRVVRNTLLDALRKRGREEPLVEDLPAAAEDAAEVCGCVLAQAQELKPEYAWVLRRAIVDGASAAQLAQELGITVNNATVRLHRARKALKARLAAHCGTTTAEACADCGCMERGCCRPPADFFVPTPR